MRVLILNLSSISKVKKEKNNILYAHHIHFTKCKMCLEKNLCQKHDNFEQQSKSKPCKHNLEKCANQHSNNYHPKIYVAKRNKGKEIGGRSTFRFQPLFSQVFVMSFRSSTTSFNLLSALSLVGKFFDFLHTIHIKINRAIKVCYLASIYIEICSCIVF